MIEECAKHAPDTMQTATLLMGISFDVKRVIETLYSVQAEVSNGLCPW